MKNLRILLVEDDPSFALEVEMLLTEMKHELMAKIDDGAKAMKYILAEQPDIIIMDIDLRGKFTGVEVAEQIKHLQIPIIFTTAFNQPEVFQAAKDTNFYAYLVKPFDKLTLQSTLEKVIEEVENESDFGVGEDELSGGIVTNCVLIKGNNKLFKVRLDEINYLESEGNYCTVYTDDRKFVLKTSLKKMLEELTLEHFSPVHKSYVVQLEKLESIDLSANKLSVGSTELPLGRNFRNQLLERFKTLK